MSAIRIFLFPLCILLFFSGQNHAQSYYDFDLRTSQLKKMAQHAERKKDYFTAIAYYEKYNEIRNTNRNTAIELAHLYVKTRDYKKALKQYQRAYEIDFEKNVLALFHKGRMLMTQENYEEAIKVFGKFRKQYRGKKNYSMYSKLAKNYIEGCENALSDSSAAEHLYISHLENGVNRAYNEFSPLPTSKNELIYASILSDTVIHFDDSVYVPTSDHKTGFFVAKRDEDEWRFKENLSGPFNSTTINAGNGTYDAIGKVFYFTKCERNWKYKMICNIYKTEFKDSEWTDPVPLPKTINQKNTTSTQPTFGMDPKHGYPILYFVSDRKGGRGGTDIWYSIFKKGEYSEPRNCGGRLNTAGDEASPFYDNETNTIYFSSDGHPTYGEMDIFKSFGQKSKWMKNPENMGRPFNSPADDLYFIFGKDPKEGFFTSNREGGIALKNPTCCDDIYSFEYDELRVYNYKANIVSSDGDNEKPITEGKVQVYLLDPESLDTTLIKIMDIPEKGKMELQVQKDLDYVLIFDVPDHFSHKLRIPPKDKEWNFDSADEIKLTKITEESIVLKNIYYDFDDFRLTDKAKTAIDDYLLLVLQLNRNIKVEISSHTDSKGSGVYNIRLSQKRAESVVQYLKSKGIESSRMVAKGYGKTKPIAPNTNEDGSDNPEGREKNRRTEFKVIGYKDDLRSR